MPVYTVHAPRSAGPDAIVAPDRFVFVRDGFYVWAFLAALVWMIWNRLWWALLGYVAISIVGELAMSALGVGNGTRLLVMVLFALLMGLEGASLRRWTYSRGNWRQVDVVVADDMDSAERRFFDRFTAKRNVANDQSAVDRGAPPPTRNIPGQPFSRPPSGAHEAIIGLFPQPGASR